MKSIYKLFAVILAGVALMTFVFGAFWFAIAGVLASWAKWWIADESAHKAGK